MMVHAPKYAQSSQDRRKTNVRRETQTDHKIVYEMVKRL